ncbi:hypothetical protein DS893_00650 [Vibrionales bacterium C3R12]|nr:hypothetical protein DS893_00650 [Vibrionales bacterium C3R12]
MVDDFLVKQMEIAWSNIQHNERLRNQLFSLYLVVSGVFFATFDTTKFTGLTGKIEASSIIVFLGVFVWGIGVLFSWSYVRFGQMLQRDAQIIRNTVMNIYREYPQYKDVLSTYHHYYKHLDNKQVLKFGSINTCITFATLVISSSALTFSLFMSLADWLNCIFPDYKISSVIVIFNIVLLCNYLIKREFERRWTSPVA